MRKTIPFALATLIAFASLHSSARAQVIAASSGLSALDLSKPLFVTPSHSAFGCTTVEGAERAVQNDTLVLSTAGCSFLPSDTAAHAVGAPEYMSLSFPGAPSGDSVLNAIVHVEIPHEHNAELWVPAIYLSGRFLPICRN